MDTELVAPSDAAAPTAPAAPAEPSLSDHVAHYDRTARQNEEVEPAEPAQKPEDKGRHRAQSQKATPADVPRINSLTKQLRAAQAELERLKGTGQQTQERQPSWSERTPQAETPLVRSGSVRQPPAVVAPVSELLKTPDVSKDPLREDEFFARYPDEAYGTYQRYLSRYAVVEHAESQRQAQSETQRTQIQQHVSDIGAERLKQFGSDVGEFIATKPDFKAKAEAAGPLMNIPLPDLLTEALIASGPEMYYHLISNPALLAEMHLLTRGAAVDESNVALVQRRLSSEFAHAQAAVTGSVAVPQQRISAPRPPNPVRTGPMQTGGDPPGDGHSLAEHAKHYDPKRQRR